MTPSKQVQQYIEEARKLYAKLVGASFHNVLYSDEAVLSIAKMLQLEHLAQRKKKV